MGKYRLQRINDEIVKEMARILRNIKDPRVTGSMTTVTGCDVSPDLKYAKIYFSFLDPVKTPEEAAEKRAEIKKGLVSAHGFIRRELAASLNLRVTPELTFVADTSGEYGSEINKILNEIKAEDEKRKKEENDE